MKEGCIASIRCSVFFLLFLCTGRVDADKNPCHDSKGSKQMECENIIMPPGLCSSCGIGPFSTSGDYQDCSRTTNLESRSHCLQKFEEYVALNPCDKDRQDALVMYASSDPKLREKGRQMLDYVGYAMCENACDCIPQEHADPMNRTLDFHRGNCQAHFYYDVCKLYPNIKLIQLEGSAPVNISNLPRICPYALDYITTPDGRHFLEVPHTNHLYPEMEFVLDNFMKAEQILETSFWYECFIFETSQGRVNADEEGSDDDLVVDDDSDSEKNNTLVKHFETLRINVGETESTFKDKDGNLWLTDRYFLTDGFVYNIPKKKNILTTEDDELYRTERFTDGPMRYEIPVPHGSYNVTLGFCEIYFRRRKERIFDVTIEDEKQKKPLDIVARAGGVRMPFEIISTVSVSDGYLSIRLDPLVENPKLSTIKVEEVA